MSTQNILSAFLNRLDAMSPALATQKPNVNFTPTTGTPYQRARLLPATPENPTLGDQYHREVGFFEVTLFYPINQGSGLANARADSVKQQFARGVTMVQNGQTVKVLRTPTVSPAIESDDRYIIPISIEYYSELFTA